MAKYVAGDCQLLMSFTRFLTSVLGYDEEEAKEIAEEVEESLDDRLDVEEERALREEEDERARKQGNLSTQDLKTAEAHRLLREQKQNKK